MTRGAGRGDDAAVVSDAPSPRGSAGAAPSRRSRAARPSRPSARSPKPRRTEAAQEAERAGAERPEAARLVVARDRRLLSRAPRRRRRAPAPGRRAGAGPRRCPPSRRHRRSAACPPRAGVEVEAGRDRHPGLAQDPRAERAAVVGHLRHVGVDVEGAVRRRDPAEPGPRQPLEHQRAVGAVDREVRLELRAWRRAPPAPRPGSRAAAQMKRFCTSRSIRRTCASGTTIQPIRQPVIEKYFENELMT